MEVGVARGDDVQNNEEKKEKNEKKEKTKYDKKLDAQKAKSLHALKNCSSQDIGLYVGSTILALLTGAAVFVAALAWNTAIQKEVEKHKHPVAPWVYVMVVTVVVALLAVPIAFTRVAIASAGGDCFQVLAGGLPELNVNGVVSEI